MQGVNITEKVKMAKDPGHQTEFKPESEPIPTRDGSACQGGCQWLSHMCQTLVGSEAGLDSSLRMPGEGNKPSCQPKKSS